MAPEPALAPVIAPAIVPIVHVKVLAVDDDKLIFGLVSLQMIAVLGVVTDGVGFTVIVFGADDAVVEDKHVPLVTVISQVTELPLANVVLV